MTKQDDELNINENSEKDYIEEMIEDQNNQFNPGYYIGTGRVRPYIKASGNAMPLAIMQFFYAAVSIVIYFIYIRFVFLNNDTFTTAFSDKARLQKFIAATAVFLAALLSFLRSGTVYLRKAKLYRLKKKQLDEEDALNNINQDDEIQIAKRTCPVCGKEHDIDYPKCPYCKHIY